MGRRLVGKGTKAGAREDEKGEPGRSRHEVDQSESCLLRHLLVTRKNRIALEPASCYWGSILRHPVTYHTCLHLQRLEEGAQGTYALPHLHSHVSSFATLPLFNVWGQVPSMNTNLLPTPRSYLVVEGSPIYRTTIT